MLFDDVDELDQGATAAAEWRITGGSGVRAALLGALNQAVAELETRYAAGVIAAAAHRVRELHGGKVLSADRPSGQPVRAAKAGGMSSVVPQMGQIRRAPGLA